jgi:hypothetical protein
MTADRVLLKCACCWGLAGLDDYWCLFAYVRLGLMVGFDTCLVQFLISYRTRLGGLMQFECGVLFQTSHNGLAIFWKERFDDC